MTKWCYIIRISANANNRDHDRHGAEMCMENTTIGILTATRNRIPRHCVPG